MMMCLKLAATVVLALQMSVLNAGAATVQPSDSAVAGVAEVSCDYCLDYTDAGVSAGVVRSAYLPIVGYAMEPGSKSAVTAMPKQDMGKSATN